MCIHSYTCMYVCEYVQYVAMYTSGYVCFCCGLVVGSRYVYVGGWAAIVGSCAYFSTCVRTHSYVHTPIAVAPWFSVERRVQRVKVS